jgi:hypothetical protein
MSVDGLPIVGPLGGVDGLSVATGHGMLGHASIVTTATYVHVSQRYLESVRSPLDALNLSELVPQQQLSMNLG